MLEHQNKGSDMSDIIEWVLEMDVNPGQADNIQALVDEMVQATEANEPGALHYEYYLSDDGTRCTVLERYADSAAAMVHMGNFGANFADRFMTVFKPARLSVFGPASDELRAALTPLGASFDPQIAGFHR